MCVFQKIFVFGLSRMTAVAVLQVLACVMASAHLVTFEVGAHGSLISGDLTHVVADGDVASPPNIAVDDGWMFIGWDQSLIDVSADMTVTAQYVMAEQSGQLAKFVTSLDNDSGGNFSRAVDISGDLCVVGAPESDYQFSGAGTASVFVRRNGAWEADQLITPDDAINHQVFGAAVAIYGDRLLVSAPGKNVDGILDVGGIYAFERHNGAWTQTQLITQEEGVESYTGFGHALAMTGDFMVVGNPRFGPEGSVHVYQMIDGLWTLDDTLSPGEGEVSYNYGAVVDIDGDRLIVGADRANSTAGDGSGAAYIYQRGANGWALQQKLIGSDTQAHAKFGSSVSICGHYAAVGAKLVDFEVGGGGIYVFEESNGVWTETLRVDSTDGYTHDIGHCLALSGNFLAFGDFAGANQGSVQLYRRQSSGWVKGPSYQREFSVRIQWFAYTISISQDTVVVGAIYDGAIGNQAGSADIVDFGLDAWHVAFDLGEHGARIGGGTLSQTVVSGEAAVAPEVQADAGWFFNGWDTDFDFVTSNLTVQAQYLPVYTVTFDLAGGARIGGGQLAQEVPEGQAAEAPLIEAPSGYHFYGWNNEFDLISAHLKVTPIYLPLVEVTFDAGDHGAILRGNTVQFVPQGFSAQPPEIQADAGWGFIGWDGDIGQVTASHTLTALYVSAELVGTDETLVFPDPGSPNDVIGYGVAIDGDIAAVRALLHNDIGHSRTGVLVFKRSGDLWEQHASLIHEESRIQYGSAVAVSGNTLVIGASDRSYNVAGSVFIYVLQNDEWKLQAELRPPDIVSGDSFGKAVSLDGNRLVVGAPFDDETEANSGSAYVYERINQKWSLIAKLLPSDGGMNHFFGHSVCVSGDWIGVGAPEAYGVETHRGAVYMYRLLSDIWTPQEKVTASDGSYYDHFGHSLSIRGDEMIVGAPNYDDTLNNQGAVYFYSRDVSTWQHQQTYTDPTADSGTYLGNSVTLFGDRAVAGAPGAELGRDDFGGIYIFDRPPGDAWVIRDLIFPHEGEDDAQFGLAVALDSDTLVTVAPSAQGIPDQNGRIYFYDIGAGPMIVNFDLDGKGERAGGGELTQYIKIGSGATAPLVQGSEGWQLSDWDIDFSKVIENITVTALYIPIYPITFDLGEYGELITGNLTEMTPLGGTAPAPHVGADDGWVFSGWDTPFHDISGPITVRALFLAEDEAGYLKKDFYPSESNIQDYYGHAVSISGDTALVGAPRNLVATATSRVDVYIRRNGVWQYQATLRDESDYSHHQFGSAVAMHGDTAVVGAYSKGNGGASQGSVFVFRRENGAWLLEKELTPAEPSDYMRFGYSVAIENDTIVVGSYTDHTNGFESGSVFVFERQFGVWVETDQLISADIAEGDRFGTDVDISGNWLIVGAPGQDGSIINNGCAYLYEKVNGQWQEEQTLTATDATGRDQMGVSVAIDGDWLVVGAPDHGSVLNNAGAAYVFGKGALRWVRRAKLSSGDGAERHFGRDVAISGDHILAGAHSGSDEPGKPTGGVYLFQRNKNLWPQKDKFKTTLTDDYFGHSVSLENDVALVGAPLDSSVETFASAAYFFDFAAISHLVTFMAGEHANWVGGGQLTQWVEDKRYAEEPQLSVDTGWLLYGWDRDFENITQSISVNAILQADSDLDGMADNWEVTHFGSIGASNGQADADDDGLSDGGEWIAGSNPRDAREGYQVVQAVVAPDGRIRLDLGEAAPHPRRRYSVFASATLAEGSWIPVFHETSEESGEVTLWIDWPDRPDRCFFRVKAILLTNVPAEAPAAGQ